MATIANLNILLSLKDNASGALNKAGKNVQAWGRSLQNVGAGLTAGVTAPVLGLAVVAVKAASDLQESMSAVEQVYGGAADTVVKSSLEAATAVGLSQQEYLSTAAVLGVYGDTLGFTDSQTADFSNSLITAAADLGSFYNANTPEVLGAMQAALRGEFDPLERFGIMMNQAALEQYALENGIWDGNGALTAQQRILAAQGFIMDNMGNATGDFARTSGGLANQQKILKAQLKNTAAQMGQVLLPTITRAVKIFGELLTRFQNISPEWQKWIVLIGLAVAAVGPFLIVLGTFLTLLPAIGAALAVLTGPIGLVIAAIALLTAAYVGNWWGFRDAVDGVGGVIIGLGTEIKNLIDGGLNPISAVLTLVQQKLAGIGGENTPRVIAIIASAFGSASAAIENFLNRITDAFSKIGSAILDGNWRKALAGIGDLLAAPAKALGDFIKGITTGFDNVDRVITNVGNMFTDFGRIIQELFQGDFSGAFDVFKRAIERIPEIVSGAFGLIPWSTLWSAAKTAFDGVSGAVGDVATALYGAGADLIGGAIGGIQSMLGYVGAIVGRIPGIAVEAVGSLAETLLSAGIDLIAGLNKGVQDMFATLGLILGRVPGLAVEGVGSLIETLVSAGIELIGGLNQGIQGMFENLKLVLGRVPGIAVSAVGDTSHTLWDTGWNLVEGFIQGILNRIPYLEEVAGTMAAIVSTIVSAWNKVTSPSKLMMEIGGYMAEGLALGIQRGIPQVEVAARGMAASASANVQADYSGQGGYGRGGGGFTNYGIYQEADRYWAPEQTMRSRALAGSRR